MSKFRTVLPAFLCMILSFFALSSVTLSHAKGDELTYGQSTVMTDFSDAQRDANGESLATHGQSSPLVIIIMAGISSFMTGLFAYLTSRMTLQLEMKKLETRSVNKELSSNGNNDNDNNNNNNNSDVINR